MAETYNSEAGYLAAIGARSRLPAGFRAGSVPIAFAPQEKTSPEMYDMNVSAYGTYSFLMLCWGDYNVPYHLKLYLTPAAGGITQTIDIEFTGKGCVG